MNDSIGVDALCARLQQHVSDVILFFLNSRSQVMQANDVYYDNDLWRTVLIVVCVCIAITGATCLSVLKENDVIRMPGECAGARCRVPHVVVLVTRHTECVHCQFGCV